MAVEPEIRIAGDSASVRQGRRTLAELPLPELMTALERAGEGHASFPVRPATARIWEIRRDAVAAAFELPPHARTVRWLCDDSKAPFGRGAHYREVYLGFPWVVVLLVFKGGTLTGQQQLYYRNAPMDPDAEGGDALFLPNLYNVAEGYGQRCWLCLQHVEEVSELAWSAKVQRVMDHTFSAAFNRSSEVHEGNSYWTRAQKVDARVESVEAWEAATRADRRFAVKVPWESAETTASEQLRGMLARVSSPRRPETTAELASLIVGAARGQRSQGGAQ